MKLYSRIYGKGAPFLVIHGLFGMNDNWSTLSRRWAETCGRSVHALDMRNHGRSPHSDEHNYTVMADDVLEYLEEHNLDRADVLGHSMGGKVAMKLAVDHPGKVHKLIVADIAPKGYPIHHADLIEAMKTLDFDRIDSRREADEALQTLIPNAGTRQFLLKSLYWENDQRLGLRFNLKAIEDNLEMVSMPGDPNARFDGPTLFLRGELSGYIRDSDKELLGKHFPNYSLHTIEGAGHWLHAEKPEEVFRTVAQFLEN